MSIKNTPLIPKVSFKYDTLHSTNATAVSAVQQKPAPGHGDVFWADAQTAGRGQGSNSWHSSPGANLTLSVVAYPEGLFADELFHLTQLTGLSVRATVEHFSGNKSNTVSVKWPNDVYVDDRKVAGILVQNGLRGNQVQWSVMGIGLNVNEQQFPEQLAGTATSLQLLTGRRHDLQEVAQYLFGQLSHYYGLLSPGRTTALAAAYHDHLYRKDLSSKFLLTATGQLFKGIIRGVNDSGQLRIEQPVGRESAFSVGEVKLLRQLNTPRGHPR